MNEEPHYEPSVELARIAVRFSAISIADPNATICYDVMADGIYWSDELPQVFPEDLLAVRILLHHRTAVLLQEASEETQVWWIFAQKYFPGWVGFLPERCTPTTELQKVIRQKMTATNEICEFPGTL